jgi:hypothetical protein
MPEVVVYLLEGRSTADQVTVSLVETPRTSKAKGGVLFSEMAGR